MSFNPKSKEQKNAPSKPRTTLPLWRKVLFSLLTLVLFFGLIELVLFIAGVKPLSYEEDPYLGFSSRIPLFIESDTGEDQKVTSRNKLSYFNKQSFPREKPKNTMRIFCVGGSTTYGRPYDDTTSFCGWLRELLPAADPSQNWELINAGGISYASYRVAALMEELSEYQPDVFIVYCGQNEFLEHRTYSGIIEMPATVRGIGAVLSRTRTYSGISRLVRNFGDKPDANAEKLDGEVSTILDQSVGPEDYERDEELESQILAHYRFNMARMVDIARSGGAKVLFISPASNLRNCAPFKSQHRDGLSAEQKTQWEGLLQNAKTNLGNKNFSQALIDLEAALNIDDQYAEAHYLHGRTLEGLQRFKEAKTAYQHALDEDVCPLRALSPMSGIVSEVAQERKIPLIDFTAMVEEASPHGIAGEELFLDHVHPTISGHRMLALALVDEMANLKWLIPSSDWNNATIERVASDIMAKVDPKKQGVAMRNLSKVYSWAGKMEDAYSAAKRALELYPGDAETHYQVGNLAHHLGKSEEAVEHLTYLVDARLNPEVSFYLKAHLQLSDILAEQGKYPQSEQILKKLIQLDPANSTGRDQLVKIMKAHGQNLIQEGRPAEAARKLSELARIQPDDFEVQVQLGMALVRAGDFAAAAPVLKAMIETRPDYLPAYDNLGFVLAQLGRLDDAEQVCLQALKIDPAHEAARKNLAIIQKKQAAGK